MKYSVKKLSVTLLLGLTLNSILLITMSYLGTDISSVRAATFTVCSGGSCDYTTIQAAVDAASVIRSQNVNYLDIFTKVNYS